MAKTLKEKGIMLQDEGMTIIQKLVHIGSMRSSYHLMEMMSDMDLVDFKSIIPSLTKRQYNEYKDMKLELFNDYDKLGFLAECEFNIPQKFNFKEDGSFQSCVNSCSSYVYFIYAETMDELLDKVIKKDRESFDEEANKARKEKGITLLSERVS